MSNPNNLVRPPVVRANDPAGNSGSANVTINEDDLVNLIGRVALDVVNRQGPSIVRATLNPNAGLADTCDQTINIEHANNLSDLDKIPDVVKCLREFSGNPAEFNSWKKSVNRVLNIYEASKGTPKFYGILNVIRNKIVGNADPALESYNTPLDWGAICKCLSLHYADKRDVSTLEYQITSLVQGNRSIEEFYQAIYSNLSLILSKLGCMEVGTEARNLLTHSYRNKALDTFVRGLNDDLPVLLGIKEPMDLPQALHLCLKLENQGFRTRYAHNTNMDHRGMQRNTAPLLPSRNFRSQVNNKNSSSKLLTYHSHKLYHKIFPLKDLIRI
uniref:Retrovirus-related Gag polyprotein from transposon HMS-Beagle n=1 Tax=Bactrocera latifrons TaxID=174628 RepID=A0A0K8USZ4_BACLA